jgi:hypothetical protein
LGPAEAKAFISHLRSGARPVAASTARGYKTALRLVLAFADSSVTRRCAGLGSDKAAVGSAGLPT